MIAGEDAHYAFEYAQHYKILPALHSWSKDPGRIGDGKRCAEGFCYSSDTNSQWMKPQELRAWIDRNPALS